MSTITKEKLEENKRLYREVENIRNDLSRVIRQEVWGERGARTVLNDKPKQRGERFIRGQGVRVKEKGR